jgi:pyruvate decarboxylase
MTLTGTVPLGQYIFERVRQLGVQHVLGVPGDFNLLLLDYVYSANLEWVGFCNELNAGYAADGYGRERHLPGVLATTYGVGELSALNAVSGAFSEHVPLLHLVGTTGRNIQRQGFKIHHAPGTLTLDPPDHTKYMQASAPFCCASEFLLSAATAAEQIDHVIIEIMKHSAPGYIYVPADMVHAPLAVGNRLETPLSFDVVNPDSSVEDKIVTDILDAIYGSKNPAILADVLVDRFNATHLVRELVDKTKFLSYNATMGKGVIDENLPQYVGVYNGTFSLPGTHDAIQSSDLVLDFGPLVTDSNGGGFTRKFKDDCHIEFDHRFVSIRGKRYMGYNFIPVLEKLIKRLDISRLPSVNLADKPVIGKLEVPAGDEVNMVSLTRSLGSFLKDDDLLVVDSGTFQFTCAEVSFHKNNFLHSQLYYSSIGYALPATIGIALARKESKKPGRIVLVDGDGASQMTVQELGTYVRQNMPITVLLLNNDGYTIERAIWGPEAGYNDICPGWQWTKMFSVFGGVEGKNCQSFRVKDRTELETLFKDDKFAVCDKPQLVEILMPKYDYPWRLQQQVQNMGQFNKTQAEILARELGEI